jgi:polysaccharide biosynthesis transport protein
VGLRRAQPGRREWVGPMRKASGKHKVIGGGAGANGLFGDDDTIDLLSVFGILRRRKWLIMAVCLVGTAIAAAIGVNLTPTYTARAAVMVDPREARVVNVEAVLSGLSPDAATMATQVGLLGSRTFLARVMDDLRLFEDPEFNVALRAPEAGQGEGVLAALSDPLASITGLLPRDWLIATGLAKDARPALESEAPRLGRELALTIFASGLSVENTAGSYLINISYTSPDRQKAALIANRIAETYVQDQLDSKLTATDKASGWLGQRLEALREEVRQAEQAVADYSAKNNLVATGAEGVTLNDQELSELNQQLITARADLAERDAKLRLVRELRGGRSSDALEAIADVASSPVIQNLRQQETELLREEAELRSLYGAKHPRIVNLRNEKENLAGKIRAEVNRIAQTLENDVRVARSRVASLEGQLGGLKNQNKTDRTAQIKLAELQRTAAASRQIYESFLQRYKETEEQDEIQQPDVRVVTVAAPPTAPSSPGPKILTAAGFTVSFVLGSVLALLLERLDRGIRSAREVEAILGLPTFGLIPRLERLKRNQKPHQYLREKPLSAYAEAVRSVFTALKAAPAGGQGAGAAAAPKVFMVTSSLPEEGKTTLVVSLATLAARSNKRVLVVDLDLRHPSVHRELGWQVSAGIVEYMSNERSLEEVIHHDLETGLHFLPVKAQTTNPLDLIESDRMRQLLEICRANYDYVLIDTAPVASVNDSKIAAQLADKVVFVVHWGKTIESAARDSLHALRESGVEVAGAVLTQIDLRKHAQYGYGDIGQYYNRSQRYYVN